MGGLCVLALLCGLTQRRAPSRSLKLSERSLSAQLQTRLWRAYPLSPESPELPSELCDRSAAQGPPLSLLMMGDSRADRPGLGPSARWPSLMSAALQRGPQLLIHLGDWVTRGRDLREWRYALEAALSSGLPLLTVRGNHDRGPHWAPLGLDGLGRAQAEPEPLRVTRVGELLIYLLDSEADERVARAAVEAHLEAQRGAQRGAHGRGGRCAAPRHTLWLQHRPLWSRGPHGSDERGWAHWLVPALESLGVQLFLAGHDHNYERMERTRGWGAARAPHPKGVVYVTSGGAGAVNAPLPDLSWRLSARQRRQDRALSRRFSAAPHTLSLRLSSEGLQLEAWASSSAGRSALIDELLIPPHAPQNGIGMRRKGR